MRRVYLDSNVFISLFNREVGRGIRGLFVEAEQFFERVKEQNHVIVLSNLFFDEVLRRTHLSQGEVTAYLKEHRINVEIAIIKPNLPWRALVAQGLHNSDALHAAAAIAFNCDCVVTFNTKHFEKARSKIKVVEPADFD